MLWVHGIINILILLVRGRVKTSEFDVHRSHILTSKDGPTVKRLKVPAGLTSGALEQENSNFQSHEFASLYRDLQLRVTENPLHL